MQLAQQMEADREAAERGRAAAQARVLELQTRARADSAQAGRLAALEAQIRAQEELAERASARSAALRRELEAAQRENAQLAAHLSAAQQSLRQAPTPVALHAAQEAERSARARIAELESAQDAARRENEQLAARLAAAQRSQQDAPTRIAVLSAQQAERSARARAAELERELHAAQAELGRLTAQLADAQAALAEAQAKQASAGLDERRRSEERTRQILEGLRAENAQLAQALARAEERGRRVEAVSAEHEKRATEAHQQLRDVYARLAAAQAEQERAQERAQERDRAADERLEAAEAALRAEEEAHQAALAELQRHKAARVAVAADLAPATVRRPPVAVLPAEQVVAQILASLETILCQQKPRRVDEVRTFLRGSDEVLRAFGSIAVKLVRQMRADGETDSTALARRALDRTRSHMLRSLEGAERESVREYLQTIRDVLSRLVQGLVAYLEDEAVQGQPSSRELRPWSEHAQEVLARYMDALRRVPDAGPEVARWLEEMQPLLQQFSEAALERIRRDAQRGAPRLPAGQLALDCVEELAWRHFDTDADAAQWAQQHHVAITKLVEWLLIARMK